VVGRHCSFTDDHNYAYGQNMFNLSAVRPLGKYDSASGVGAKPASVPYLNVF
jgi:hypothetical protein